MERLSWTCTLKGNGAFLSYLEQVFPEQLQVSAVVGILTYWRKPGQLTDRSKQF